MAFWVVLTLIAVCDWQTRTIPNRLLVILLATLVLGGTGVAGVSTTGFAINWLLILLLTLPGYIKGIVGGGDIKLLAVLTPVWPPLALLQIFSFGVLSLLGLMMLGKSLNRSPAAVLCSGSDQTSPGNQTLNAITSRSLPLGTAIGLGAAIYYFTGGLV